MMLMQPGNKVAEDKSSAHLREQFWRNFQELAFCCKQLASNAPETDGLEEGMASSAFNLTSETTIARSSHVKQKCPEPLVSPFPIPVTEPPRCLDVSASLQGPQPCSPGRWRANRSLSAWPEEHSAPGPEAGLRLCQAFPMPPGRRPWLSPPPGLAP